MKRTSGRLVFKIGEVFPPDDPVAVFLAMVSSALNDLVTVSKWLVGGNDEGPDEVEVSDVERQYLLRLTIAQLYEVRESIKHARKQPPINDFLSQLPGQARHDLERLMTINTRDAPWALAAIEHVRHQTNHYGGKWNWDDVKWAMKQAAETEGEVEMRNEKLAGMRLRFADSIANQQLARKWPEYVDDPDAELDEETIGRRLSELFIATREAVIAAQNFAVAAIDAYLKTLPEDLVRVEDLID